MITLFRRIRQKLIDSGNITKYLLYAIGEIALVMIGILLALQVNNWNEEIKAGIEEQVILKSLLDEYIETRLRLMETIALQEDMLNRTDDLYKWYQQEGDSSEQQLDSLGTFLSYGALSFWRVEPVVGNYEALLGSGKTELISDKELSRRMSEFHAETVSGFEDHELSLNLIARLVERSGRFTFYLTDERLQNHTGIYITKDESFIDGIRQEAVRKLKDDFEFFGILYEKTILEVNRLNWQTDLLEKSEQIITIVEQNLD